MYICGGFMVWSTAIQQKVDQAKSKYSLTKVVNMKISLLYLWKKSTYLSIHYHVHVEKLSTLPIEMIIKLSDRKSPCSMTFPRLEQAFSSGLHYAKVSEFHVNHYIERQKFHEAVNSCIHI